MKILFTKDESMQGDYPDEPENLELEVYGVQLTYNELRDGDGDAFAMLAHMGCWCDEETQGHWSDIVIGDE